MLKIENSIKIYRNGKRAMDDFSCDIAGGKLLGFVSANGAGKSTTIKACCGIHDFNSGNIWIDGISVKDNPILCKQKLSYVPDQSSPYEYLTTSLNYSLKDLIQMFLFRPNAVLPVHQFHLIK